MQSVEPASWWRNVDQDNVHVKTEILSLINTLMNAIASSASIERVFSTFGLVHSKIRNRLGVEKASKLVFLHRVLTKEDN